MSHVIVSLDLNLHQNKAFAYKTL